jgi:MerR family mercuric resistance operon transcriptional regulator
MPQITIGKLSEKTGCNIETIRYYERIGLLRKPLRSAGGHRLYGEMDVRHLTFVRRSRELGFTLDAVRNLLGHIDGGDYTCAEIKIIAVDHLAEVRSKLAELKRLERALKDMIATCDGGDVIDCPILESLYA